jgi:hypothetical protein
MRGAMEGRSPLLKKTPNNSPEKQKIWKKKFRLSLRNFSFRLAAAAAPELLESRRTKTIEGQQRIVGKTDSTWKRWQSRRGRTEEDDPMTAQ